MCSHYSIKIDSPDFHFRLYSHSFSQEGHPRPIILFSTIILFKGKDKAGCYVSNLRMGMNLSLFLLCPPVLKQTKAEKIKRASHFLE